MNKSGSRNGAANSNTMVLISLLISSVNLSARAECIFQQIKNHKEVGRNSFAPAILNVPRPLWSFVWLDVKTNFSLSSLIAQLMMFFRIFCVGRVFATLMCDFCILFYPIYIQFSAWKQRIRTGSAMRRIFDSYYH